MQFGLLLSFCLLTSGCASTSIYEDGHTVFTTQANMTGVDFVTGRTRFHADTINHSDPTLAGGQAFTHAMSGVSGVATAIGGTIVAGGL